MNYKKKLRLIAFAVASSIVIMTSVVSIKYFIFERPKVIAKQKEAERKDLLQTSLRKKADESVEDNIRKFCERPDSINSTQLLTYWIYGHHQQFPGWKTTESSCLNGSCDSKLVLSNSVQDNISAVNAIRYILDKMKLESPEANKFSYSFDKSYKRLSINDFYVESMLNTDGDKQCGIDIPFSKDVSLLMDQLYGIVELYKNEQILIDVREQRHISYAHQKMVKLNELSKNLFVQELDVYAADLQEINLFIRTLNELSPWPWKLHGFEYPIKAKKKFSGYKITLFILVKK